MSLFGADPGPGAGPEAARRARSGKDSDAPVLPAPASERALALAAKAPGGVRLGTSSWSFPGWGGLVYAGVHDTRALARRGLRAYASHPLLKTVGLDKTYYAPITEGGYAELASAVAPGFRFLVKAHALLMQPTVRSGEGWARNELFLHAGYALEKVVGPATVGLGGACGPIVFQFSPMRLHESRGELTPERVLERLEAFLQALPRRTDAREGFYAVEIRNAQLLTPRYAAMLARLGVSHSFVAHPAMPGLERQAAAVDASSGPALVGRWMLHEGRTYEDSKDLYAPFDRIIDADPAVRRGYVDLLEQSVKAQRSAWVIVNNKAEGSAPESVRLLWEGLIARLDGPAR
jgi:uncharacterized protein YecE (DUF72 family)